MRCLQCSKGEVLFITVVVALEGGVKLIVIAGACAKHSLHISSLNIVNACLALTKDLEARPQPLAFATMELLQIASRDRRLRVRKDRPEALVRNTAHLPEACCGAGVVL